MSLSIGEKAPDFVVNDQDGKPVRLSAMKGKKVVLYFYPKDMTPGCTVEACNLRDNYKLLIKQGYEVLGISTDNEKTHQKFITKENLSFRQLSDTDKQVHNLYGTWVEKSMYGRKFMGITRTTLLIGPDGRIARIWPKVRVKGHAQEVLEAAEEL
jgi:peroxiredoxin Q/BCP